MEVRVLSSAPKYMERPGNQQLNIQQVRERLVGYFDGKNGELDVEIASFRELGEGVRIEGGQIIRPELSVEALERVKRELTEVRNYIRDLLDNLQPDSTEAAK